MRTLWRCRLGSLPDHMHEGEVFEPFALVPPLSPVLSYGGAAPAWDEPGPCDCGVPPDECAMKAFRLSDASAGSASLAAGAETFRQLSAAIVDLQVVRASRVRGLRPGYRVLVARRAECVDALGPDDAVLDGAGEARARSAASWLGPPCCSPFRCWDTSCS